ncbi:MAG: hypothetical protein H0X42_05270 [Solirubrobacterales bacterium]|nr:hypothetical protein [Solirubrobacterales bacterium]
MIGRGEDPVAAVELGALQLHPLVAVDQRIGGPAQEVLVLDPLAEQPGDEALGLRHVSYGDGEMRLAPGLDALGVGGDGAQGVISASIASTYFESQPVITASTLRSSPAASRGVVRDRWAPTSRLRPRAAA